MIVTSSAVLVSTLELRFAFFSTFSVIKCYDEGMQRGGGLVAADVSSDVICYICCCFVLVFVYFFVFLMVSSNLLETIHESSPAIFLQCCHGQTLLEFVELLWLV